MTARSPAICAPPAELIAACHARAAIVERIDDADEQPLPYEIPFESRELFDLRQRLAEIDQDIAERVCAWLLGHCA
jgi:hypothetical protein